MVYFALPDKIGGSFKDSSGGSFLDSSGEVVASKIEGSFSIAVKVWRTVRTLHPLHSGFARVDASYTI